MNLQDAIVEVIEDWRDKRGLTQIAIGQIIAPNASSPRVAGEIWSDISKGRRETGKKRGLDISELEALADYFMVNPETIIMEARQRMGLISGSREKPARTA